MAATICHFKKGNKPTKKQTKKSIANKQKLNISKNKKKLHHKVVFITITQDSNKQNQKGNAKPCRRYRLKRHLLRVNYK